MLNIFKREITLHLANQSAWLSIILFYVLVIGLFPLVLGPTPPALTWIAPIIIWVAALLTTVVTQETLLRDDYQLGVLEQLLLSRSSFTLLITSKITAQWLIFAVPMLILTPLLAFSLGMSWQNIGPICAGLFLGTISLQFIGALGAALTVALPRGGMLLALLVLPLYAPVLVLGAGVGVLSVQGLPVSAYLALLAALAILSCLFIPFAIAAAIKANVQ
jgi:heme exporter protein B